MLVIEKLESFTYVSFLQAAVGTMDFIIDTISAVHPLYPLISLLKLNGKLITVGLPDKPLELPIFPLVLGKMRSFVSLLLNFANFIL